MNENEDWPSWIGKIVRKRSKKPFKGGSSIALVRGISVNEYSGKMAFVFWNNPSTVDCYQCRLSEADDWENDCNELIIIEERI